MSTARNYIFILQLSHYAEVAVPTNPWIKPYCWDCETVIR